MNWSDRRLLELFGIDHPIVQAPMAGFDLAGHGVAVSEAGGLGSIAGAMATPESLRAELQIVRQGTGRPFNVNFFVHIASPSRMRRASSAGASGSRRTIASSACPRMPAPAGRCAGAVRCRPVRRGAGVQAQGRELPFRPARAGLVKRLKDERIAIVSSATTAAEARWLEGAGVDAVIAQGAEAGGHRGMFLADDIARQAGTMALVPQVVDAVKVPVIAAGGIGDGRGIAAALALGAAGVQIGTAFLLTPEARTAALHRAALKQANDDSTTLTNLFTGRPARGIVNRYIARGRADERRRAGNFRWRPAPPGRCRAASEAKGSSDFMPSLERPGADRWRARCRRAN